MLLLALTSLVGLGQGCSHQTRHNRQAMQQQPGTYPMIEFAFHVPLVAGGTPFEREIVGLVRTPTGALRTVPAFYDGDDLWRIRYTPDAPGEHSLAEVRETAGAASGSLNVRPTAPLTHSVSGAPAPGFIRRSPKLVQQFMFDNGAPFFPFGQNVAWASPTEYQKYFSKMAAVGQNWSRVWMTHWACLNLDWNLCEPTSPGMLSLDAARRWDEILRTAEANGIFFQLVLQHHGQYNTFINSNWAGNPLNQANGGCLKLPEDFFTSPEARRLCRLKYRYIVARFGYSPAIMAWELFNEVELTDAFIGREAVDAIHHPSLKAAPALLKRGDVAPIAAWHTEMAEYIRSIDPYHHLITTSSPPVDSPIWQALDYYQLHNYQPEMLKTISRFPDFARLRKPIFYGEVGDHNIEADNKHDGRYMRSMLWAGLMAGGAGTPQIWAWDQTERLDFYRQFKVISQFIQLAGLGRLSFTPIDIGLNLIGGAPEAESHLGVYGAQSGDHFIVWMFHRLNIHEDSTTQARSEIILPARAAGAFDVTWWDTEQGRPLDRQRITHQGSDGLRIATPEISRDLAAIVEPVQ
jgi:hypothetical protein